ncbi:MULTISPECIES: hypothetical protein [unclassified Roseobacter]|uniref:hypothetical protein n=1 Tax=unclassified Roseobacter TaxID=196798 RepID=UPI001491BAFF|nr:MULTISPECIES: hypothetical protein [unclassified Roseobacter]NNW55464.1 hypothetical protein [Roseobacter sp. HKCCD8284]NNY17295.1 hypothetical protein [Roseobacter sp. HKCCD8191]
MIQLIKLPSPELRAEQAKAIASAEGLVLRLALEEGWDINCAILAVSFNIKAELQNMYVEEEND